MGCNDPMLVSEYIPSALYTRRGYYFDKTISPDHGQEGCEIQKIHSTIQAIVVNLLTTQNLGGFFIQKKQENDT